MKTILSLFLFFETIYAEDFSKITISLTNIIIAFLIILVIILVIIIIFNNKKIKELNKTIKERDEKIQWLRKVFVQKENTLNKNIKNLEDQISNLNHTIDLLEQKLKEGTKNQVVTKLESLQRKREEILSKLKEQ